MIYQKSKALRLGSKESSQVGWKTRKRKLKKLRCKSCRSTDMSIAKEANPFKNWRRRLCRCPVSLQQLFWDWRKAPRSLCRAGRLLKMMAGRRTHDRNHFPEILLYRQNQMTLHGYHLTKIKEMGLWVGIIKKFCDFYTPAKRAWFNKRTNNSRYYPRVSSLPIVSSIHCRSGGHRSSGTIRSAINRKPDWPGDVQTLRQVTGLKSCILFYKKNFGRVEPSLHTEWITCGG